MKAMGALIMSLALSACSAQDDRAAVDYSTIEIPIDRLSSDDTRDRGRALFQSAPTGTVFGARVCLARQRISRVRTGVQVRVPGRCTWC
jgi:hypothetical protein